MKQGLVMALFQRQARPMLNRTLDCGIQTESPVADAWGRLERDATCPNTTKLME